MTDKTRLLIQIPAYNEEAYIEKAIYDIPRTVPGFDEVKIVVINDGSTDETAMRARKAGAECLDLDGHCGMGAAFCKGIEYGLSIGSDCIVNTDADLQYQGSDIKNLVRPILDKTADLVIAERNLDSIAGYPFLKLLSQKIGNGVASRLLRVEVKDITSGFRAHSRNAAGILLNNLRNDYDYAIESVCAIARKGMRIRFVPVDITYPTRSSRLIRSKIYYVSNFFSTLFKGSLRDYR